MKDLLDSINKLEQQPEIVKVFGSILYTNRHPNIKKALRDPDYWDALHEISGERWVIFSVQAKEGEYSFASLPPGYLGLMLPVWKEPRENIKLIEYLGIKSSEKPCFVIFTRLHNGTILKSVINLNDNSVEEAFDRIRKIVSEITEAVEIIEEKNIQDYESVFNAIEMTVSRINTLETLKNVLGIYQFFKNMIP